MRPSIEHMVRVPRRLPRQPRRLRQEVARSGEWSALSQGEGGGSGGATGWWISPRGGQQRRRGEAALGGGRGGGRYAWVWVLEGVFGSELSLALAWWTEANLSPRRAQSSAVADRRLASRVEVPESEERRGVK
jgi:hypothetical protein